jgi:hypothetical protein
LSQKGKLMQTGRETLVRPHNCEEERKTKKFSGEIDK